MKFLSPKLTKVLVVLALGLQLFCCKDRFSSRYTLEMPQTPETWVSLLGEPHWRLEWLNSNGQKQTMNISPGERVEIELPVTWTNPVTALPYWPVYNLIPGFFKPAGALFPFDVSGKTLPLTWEAGPDTVFYWELGYANNHETSKIPANFDWPRFRELLASDVLNAAVQKDPWLVDWRFVAEKTINSNFDRRRLVPKAAKPVSIPVPSGYWYGTSPFAEPLYFTDNETPVFPVNAGINVWVSNEGILRCTDRAWVFTPNF